MVYAAFSSANGGASGLGGFAVFTLAGRSGGGGGGGSFSPFFTILGGVNLVTSTLGGGGGGGSCLCAFLLLVTVTGMASDPFSTVGLAGAFLGCCA